MSDHAWDVFVYTDFSSRERPEMGRLLPGFRESHYVVAVGPPIHEGREGTIVLGHGPDPMPEVQALLDRLKES